MFNWGSRTEWRITRQLARTSPGARFWSRGKSRFETIANTAGVVLGYRPLELDGLAPADFDVVGPGAVSRVWGWHTIVRLAEEYFGD